MQDITRQQLAKAARKPVVARSKYNARKTTVDGIVFDSAKEAARYQELRVLEKAGEIAGLQCQFVYELFAPRIYVAGMEGLKAHRPHAVIGKYIADFIYYSTREPGLIVEDVKGFKTPLYRWKKKHVEAQFGFVIREV